jgi:hypothetical protein
VGKLRGFGGAASKKPLDGTCVMVKIFSFGGPGDVYICERFRQAMLRAGKL